MVEVKVCSINFKNPIILASGPCGNGKELSKYLDLSSIGAFTAKTVTPKPIDGNPPPRIVNIENGLLNSIGLQNPGVDSFIKNDLPFLKEIPTNLIVSVGGYNSADFKFMIKSLNFEYIKIIELNLSCPNVEKAGSSLGEDPKKIYGIVSSVRELTDKPLFVKLGYHPEVEKLAKAAVDAGIDGITLINSLKGMKVDIKTGKPILENSIGGVSGPIIKPFAIATVYKIRKLFPNLPIIGMGGVVDYKDALEFIMAGANLVGVGFGAMMDPEIPANIVCDLEEYLRLRDLRLKDVFSIAHKGGANVL